MKGPDFQQLLPSQSLPSLSAYMVAQRQGIASAYAFLFSRRILMLGILLCGCTGFNVKTTFKEAHELFEQGDYEDALSKYAQIASNHPEKGDRILFEMGIIYSHPRNDRRHFQKALESFERLLKDYPASSYRQDAQMMVFYIHNVVVKDETIAVQKRTIETLKHQVESEGDEVLALQRQIKDLEHKVFALAAQKGSVDKILVQKGERRLMLLSKGEVLKTYKIALGGNPNGPKERQGDNKTPEGVYSIDSRNTDSRYHLSLHVSYPNEKDKKRARELGVSPGGDIMIHGIKNGFSWVGDAHTQADWTKGCIAVTDEEIEEIARVVPNGTTVEIRP